jgi:hypothetical protein
MKDVTFVYELDGKKIEMRMKENPYEIEDCENGKFVHLFLKNYEEYQGYFNGMDGDDIILKPIKSRWSLPIPISRVNKYLEEI